MCPSGGGYLATTLVRNGCKMKAGWMIMIPEDAQEA
jgi:hypothetical protein